MTTTAKTLLKYRNFSGPVFWKEQIRNPEEAKTRQAEYVLSVPTHPKVIFYESMSGARMMDSPYALFLRLYNDSDFKKFHHVWSVRSAELIPDKLMDDPRITFVTRGTDAHLYFLALAGFIIGNSLLPEHFVRKTDQKYLNTWHGIAYKALGRTDTSPLGAAGSVYNMLQATHVLTPCPYMTEAELTRFSLRGVFSGSMAEIGYPRQDLTLNMTESKAQELRETLRLDPTKMTVLYAPTWRGNKGSARFDGEQLQRDIQALAALDANVIFQAHHIMLRHIKNVDYGNIIVPPASSNANEILAVVDLLISDYSSIFFDFLATGLPVVHYLYDYHEYTEERGLLLDQSDLPGPIVSTADELVSTVTNLISQPYEPTPAYRQAQDRFCPHDDGHACDRTIRWFMLDDGSDIKQIEARVRPTVIFWGGRLDKTRKTEAFLDSVSAAAKTDDKDVTLFVSHSVKSNNVAMNRIRNLDPSISLIARNDFEMIMTAEEIQARHGNSVSQTPREPSERNTAWSRLRRTFTRNTLDAEPEVGPLDSMYRREYRRVFGDAKFDELVEFDGLSSFWKRLAQHALK